MTQLFSRCLSQGQCTPLCSPRDFQAKFNLGQPGSFLDGALTRASVHAWRFLAKCRYHPKTQCQKLSNNDRKVLALMKQTWTNCTKKQAIIILQHEPKIGYVEHFLAFFSGLALLVFQKCPHKQLFSNISNQFCRSWSLISIKAAQTGFGVVLILIKLEMTTPHWFTNGHLIISLLLFAKVYNRISYTAWVLVLHIKQISTSDSSPQRKKKRSLIKIFPRGSLEAKQNKYFTHFKYFVLRARLIFSLLTLSDYEGFSVMVKEAIEITVFLIKKLMKRDHQSQWFSHVIGSIMGWLPTFIPSNEFSIWKDFERLSNHVDWRGDPSEAHSLIWLGICWDFPKEGKRSKLQQAQKQREGQAVSVCIMDYFSRVQNSPTTERGLNVVPQVKRAGYSQRLSNWKLPKANCRAINTVRWENKWTSTQMIRRMKLQ